MPNKKFRKFHSPNHTFQQHHIFFFHLDKLKLWKMNSVLQRARYFCETVFGRTASHQGFPEQVHVPVPGSHAWPCCPPWERGLSCLSWSCLIGMQQLLSQLTSF